MKKIFNQKGKSIKDKSRIGFLKLLLMMMVLLIMGSRVANGQVVFENSAFTTIANGTTATSITMNYDPGTANNKFMVVAVTTSRYDVTSVTFGGDPLVELGDVVNGDSRVVFFTMSDPPSGTATLEAVLVSDNRGFVMGVVTFSNVDLTNPHKAFTSATGSSATPTVSNVPTSAGSIVFSAVSQDDSRDGFLTFGTDQVERWKFGSLADSRHNSAGSTKSIISGTSTSMSYSHTRSSNYSIGALSINATPSADLSITKTVSNPAPYIGQTITFTLTATNNGNDNAPNVTVNDLLPSGYTLVSSSTATGTYNGGTGVWDIGTLNTGTSATLSINAVVNKTGDYSNSATITGDVIDNNSGNNSATISIIACQAGGTAPLFNN